MTAFSATPVPTVVSVNQWAGNNQADIESWLGTPVTVNDDQSITFTPPDSPHGTSGVTCPLGGYIVYPGWQCYTTNPAAPGGPYQPLTLGQTYVLSS